MLQKLILHFSPSGRSEAIQLNEGEMMTAGKLKESRSDFLDLKPNIPEQLLGRISRTHFQLLRQDGQFYLTDAGSTNGTFIQGWRIPKGQLVLLCDKDEITLSGEAKAELCITVALEVVDASTDPDQTDLVTPSPNPVLDQIQQKLYQPGHLMLLAPPGSGKTTLLNTLRLETQGDGLQALPVHRFFTFCYLDCLTLAEFTTPYFFGKLADQLAYLITELNLIPNKPATLTPADTDPQRQVLQLVNLIWKEARKKTVFILDHLDDIQADLSPELYADLKGLPRQTQDRIVYVIAMKNELEQGNQQIQQFLRDIGRKEWLPPYEDLQLKTMLNDANLSTSKIRGLSGGRPRLAELVAQQWQGQSEEMQNAEDDRLWATLLQEKEIVRHCEEIWVSFRDEEKNELLSLINHQVIVSDEVRLDLTRNKHILAEQDQTLQFRSRLLEMYIKQTQSSLKIDLRKVGAIGLQVDDDEPLVFLNGESATLPEREWRLLKYLVSSRNVTCKTDDIAQAVWGADFVDLGNENSQRDHIDPVRENVNQVISRTRKLLNKLEAGAGDKYIVNVRGVGYKYQV